MTTLLWSILFLLAAAITVVAAELFIGHLTKSSSKKEIPSFLSFAIPVFLVALPELLIALIATWKDFSSMVPTYVTGANLINLLLIPGIMALTAGSFQAQKEEKTLTAETTPTITLADPSLGPVKAAITIIEYADFRCPHCAAADRLAIPALPAAALKALAEHDYQICLIDVRLPSELDVLRMPGSRSLPIGALRARLGELPRDRTIVLICKLGLRSYEASIILTASGFPDVRVLDGGLDAWPFELERLA